METKKLTQATNELILHQNLVKFRGSLTPLQSKGIFVLLKNANEIAKKDCYQENFEIPFEEFEKLIGSRIYSKTAGIIQRKEFLKQSMKKIIETNFGFGMTKQTVEKTFLEYFEIKNDNIIKYRFSLYVRECLNTCDKALIIKDFSFFMSFKSEYARQLYKHILAWISTRTELTFQLEDLKDFLGATANSYSRFDNFENKVLKVAVNEINKLTKWNLIYKKNKDGAKIESVHFFWNKQ